MCQPLLCTNLTLPFRKIFSQLTLWYFSGTYKTQDAPENAEGEGQMMGCVISMTKSFCVGVDFASCVVYCIKLNLNGNFLIAGMKSHKRRNTFFVMGHN